jgi:ABC-type Na+ efflux pump permease subunit/membrane protease YdiL (CAAX protease family)
MIGSPVTRAVLKLDLRLLIRDTRTLLMAVVLPVVILPIFLVLSQRSQEQAENRADARVFRAAWVGDALPALADWRDQGAPDRLQWVPMEDPEMAGAALETRELDVWIETVHRGDPSAEAEAEAEGPTIRIHYRGDRDASGDAASLVRRSLLDYRETVRAELLATAGFPIPVEAILPLETVNLAPAEQVAGARLGLFLTPLLLLLVLIGGSVMALDGIAGEKERGTLLTLMASGAPRRDLILGKLGAVVAVGLGIGTIQIVNLWIAQTLFASGDGAGWGLSLAPGTAVALLLLYFPAVVLVGGVLLLSSAWSRSYKEAQLYFTPVMLLLLLPSLAGLLPDLTLRSAILLLPLANLSVGVRDLLAGQGDPLGLAAVWAVNALAAGWVLRRTVHTLEDEARLTGDTSQAEFLGGPALWPRRVLVWVLVLWAAKFMLDVNLSVDDLRLSILLQVGVVFTLFPLLAIRVFRLNVREALSLRAPRPAPQVWLAVLLGVPAGLICTQGVFHLVNQVIPVPTEVLERFGQAMAPGDIPGWQLLLLLALIPGITEELTFRGVILHGLRRRLRPLQLVLVMGLIFGIFHMAIFRIFPTGFLGGLLTAVTLMTGSIFPAIVWHTLHNGLAVGLSLWTSEAETGALGLGGMAETLQGWFENPWSSLVGVPLLAFSLWTLWRHRVRNEP